MLSTEVSILAISSPILVGLLSTNVLDGLRTIASKVEAVGAPRTVGCGLFGGKEVDATGALGTVSWE